MASRVLTLDQGGEGKMFKPPPSENEVKMAILGYF